MFLLLQYLFKVSLEIFNYFKRMINIHYGNNEIFKTTLCYSSIPRKYLIACKLNCVLMLTYLWLLFYGICPHYEATDVLLSISSLASSFGGVFPEDVCHPVHAGISTILWGGPWLWFSNGDESERFGLLSQVIKSCRIPGINTKGTGISKYHGFSMEFFSFMIA